MATETWLTDVNGNRCSVEYFGSKEAAQVALDSLKNCRDCENCSDCYGCSGCSDTKNKSEEQDGFSPPQIPKIADIDKAVYAACSQPQALHMSTWRTCETAPCRAGWVVTLAGEAGAALESYHGSTLAAQLIYCESGAPINPCRFFDNNADALADMKQRAEAA